MSKKKSTLGRGLSGLISKGASRSTPPTKKPQPKPKTTTPPSPRPTKIANTPTSPFQEIDISLIEPNPFQPRLDINPDSIKELAASIQKEGLLQPILVRKKDNSFQLIAGERRWRACQSLNLKSIPARITNVSDASSAVIALIENLQRENLNPIDEAMGFSSLIRDFDLTQDQASQKVGKPRTSIANALRLLNLEQEIQAYLSKNILSVGHAKVLLSSPSGPQRLLLARKIIENGLSVRDAEKLIKSPPPSLTQKSHKSPITPIQSAVINDLQKQLTHHLSTQVSIQHKNNKGKIVINYKNNEELNRILEKIDFLKKSSSAA